MTCNCNPGQCNDTLAPDCKLADKACVCPFPRTECPGCEYACPGCTEAYNEAAEQREAALSRKRWPGRCAGNCSCSLGAYAAGMKCCHNCRAAGCGRDSQLAPCRLSDPPATVAAPNQSGPHVPVELPATTCTPGVPQAVGTITVPPSDGWLRLDHQERVFILEALKARHPRSKGRLVRSLLDKCAPTLAMLAANQDAWAVGKAEFETRRDEVAAPNQPAAPPGSALPGGHTTGCDVWSMGAFCTCGADNAKADHPAPVAAPMVCQSKLSGADLSRCICGGECSRGYFCGNCKEADWRIDPVHVEADGMGFSPEVYRIVRASEREKMRKLGTTARPKYIATVYSRDDAGTIATALNRLASLEHDNRVLTERTREWERLYDECKAKWIACEDSEKELQGKLAELVREKDELRRQLTFQSENNHQRNLELDALHYVWCNGGCKYGVHRWTEETVTEELVAAAERNTARLRTWLENKQHRDERASGAPVPTKETP